MRRTFLAAIIRLCTYDTRFISKKLRAEFTQNLTFLKKCLTNDVLPALRVSRDVIVLVNPQNHDKSEIICQSWWVFRGGGDKWRVTAATRASPDQIHR